MQRGRGCCAAYFEDFVFELKFSPFEFGQFKLIDSRMDESFFYFLVESLVALLERGQMSFERHAELPVEAWRNMSVPQLFGFAKPFATPR